MSALSDTNWRPKYLPLIMLALVTSFLTSNILSFKIVELFGLKFGASAIFFPVSLIIGDILSEVYGYKRAKFAIFMGFIAYLYFVIVSQITTALPPAPEWTLQEDYARFFGFATRVFIGGCLAYLGGELANAYILTRMKVMQKGRHFWQRAMVSTVFGEFFHSAIRAPIVFWGILSGSQLVELVITATIIKVLVEALILPLTTWIIVRLKRAEGVDHYDTKPT